MQQGLKIERGQDKFLVEVNVIKSNTVPGTRYEITKKAQRN